MNFTNEPNFLRQNYKLQTFSRRFQLEGKILLVTNCCPNNNNKSVKEKCLTAARNIEIQFSWLSFLIRVPSGTATNARVILIFFSKF